MRTVDCRYLGREGVAAAYLMVEGARAAFVEANTARALPRLLGALEEAGRSPEDVELIIVTHVHLDHAGGAWALMQACPNATLLAHPRAAPHAIDPERLVRSARQVYGEARFETLYGSVEKIDAARVRVMEDGEELAFGSRALTFVHTRGHANHHFCVYDSGSRGIFTGDSFGLIYPQLQKEGLFAFPSTSPTDFDPAEAKRSLDRIVATGAEHAYLTHFGAHEGLGAIAEELRAQLDVYEAMLEEADASGLEGEGLSSFCRERTRAIFARELRERGLDTDPAAVALVETDTELNAQGVAFAVQKRRHKRAQSAR